MRRIQCGCTRLLTALIYEPPSHLPFPDSMLDDDGDHGYMEDAPVGASVKGDPPPEVQGYPQLAHHMGTISDSLIFRRFASLNAKNLLYLQAELMNLETKLRKYELADSRCSGSNRSTYGRDWYWLSRSAEDGSTKQWRTVLSIRKKLRIYSEDERPFSSAPLHSLPLERMRYEYRRIS